MNINKYNNDFNYSNYNENSISKISKNILFNNLNKLKIRTKSNNKTKKNLKFSNNANINSNNNILRNSCIDFKYIFNIEEEKLEKIKEENNILKNKLMESQTTIKNLQNIIQNLIIKDNNNDIKINNNNEIKNYIPQPTPYVNIISYNDNIDNNNLYKENNININNKSNKLIEKNKKRIKIKKYYKSYSKDNFFISK
jgi:hypothetical protein